MCVVLSILCRFLDILALPEAHGIQEVSGSIPLISTKKHRNLCCGVFLSRRSSALILKTVQNSTQAPTEVCRGFLHIKR